MIFVSFITVFLQSLHWAYIYEFKSKNKKSKVHEVSTDDLIKLISTIHVLIAPDI